MPRIHRVSRLGDLNAVQECIAEGCDINEFSIHGMTPLMLAIKSGYRLVAEYLIQSGADVNAFDADRKNCALSVAASIGDEVMVTRLIEFGAIDQSNALAMAAMAGKQQIVDILVKTGSDLDKSVYFGKSAREWIELGGMKELSAEPPEAQIGREESLRKIVDANPNVDEYAAHHARNTLIFSFHAYSYTGEGLNEWASRFAEIIADEYLIAELEEKYLTGEALEQARIAHQRRVGWMKRQESKRKPEFVKNR